MAVPAERFTDGEKSHTQWKQGSPVEVYSNGLSKWCPGEIVSISRDSDGSCLELRYWDGAVSKQKYLNFDSPHVRRVPNTNGETRHTWKEGSKMECWSNSRAQWFEAEIVGIKEERDGEWLQLSWEVKENDQRSTMTKEVLRASLFIRPNFGRRKETSSSSPRGNVQELIPVSVEVGVQGEEGEREGESRVSVSMQDIEPNRSFEDPKAGEEERFQTLTSEMDQGLSVEVDDWEMERDMMELQIEELEGDVKRWKRKLDDVTIEKDLEIDRIKEENNALSRTIADLETLVEQLKTNHQSSERPTPAKPSPANHYTDEIDRLNRELLLAQKTSSDASNKLKLQEEKVIELEQEIKELATSNKTEIQKLSKEKEKYKKWFQNERNSRLTASSQMLDKEKEITKKEEEIMDLNDKLKQSRRQNSLIAERVSKLRSAALKQADDGSTADPALRPPIRRRGLRKYSGGDQSPISSASNESRSAGNPEIYDEITALENILSNCYNSDEERDIPMSAFERSTTRRMERMPKRRSRPLTPQQQDRPKRRKKSSSGSATPNGYHHNRTNSDTFEPAEVPDRGYYQQYPFGVFSEPPAYQTLPEDESREATNAQLIPGMHQIGSRGSFPRAVGSSPSGSSSYFTETTAITVDGDEEFPPPRTRDRSVAQTDLCRLSNDQRVSLEVAREDIAKLNGHPRHVRDISDSYPSSSTDYTNDPSTPATSSPTRKETMERIMSPIPNDTTVGRNDIVETVNVKWPRRKKSLSFMQNNRHYETTRVSLRDEGMRIEHYAGKPEPKFWRWAEVSQVRRDGSQLIVNFGEGEYIKMKLSTTDQAENWLHLLERRSQQSFNS